MNLEKDQKEKRRTERFATPTEMRETTSNYTPSLTGGGVYLAPPANGFYPRNALERETLCVMDFLQDLINGVDDHPYEPHTTESIRTELNM